MKSPVSKLGAALGLLALLLATAAPRCNQPPQEIARDSIAAAKGVIEAAQDEYQQSCQADPSQRPCQFINQAVAAQNLAIDALNLYCAGSGWAEGQPCNPQPEFEPRLREAVNELNRIIQHVKELKR